LDPTSRVLLDPTAKVRADGEIQVQSPSISPLEGTRRVTTPLITNFTVFKRVEFDRGQVWTGWKFLTSAQKFPTYQYCYYTEHWRVRSLSQSFTLVSTRSWTHQSKCPKDSTWKQHLKNVFGLREKVHDRRK